MQRAANDAALIDLIAASGKLMNGGSNAAPSKPARFLPHLRRLFCFLRAGAAF